MSFISQLHNVISFLINLHNLLDGNSHISVGFIPHRSARNQTSNLSHPAAAARLSFIVCGLIAALPGPMHLVSFQSPYPFVRSAIQSFLCHAIRSLTFATDFCYLAYGSGIPGVFLPLPKHGFDVCFLF